jgi:hypothetical protein
MTTDNQSATASESRASSGQPSMVLRAVSVVLAALMLLFIAVQYNDPDGHMWMAIYLVPTAWALIAAIAPRLLSGGVWRLLLILTILGSVALTLYYWPKTPGWWQQVVWWEVETAREGMGMMIVTAVLLFAYFVGARSRALLRV